LKEFMVQGNTNFAAGTNIILLVIYFRIRILFNSKTVFHLKF
jgi:hypothetical protein